MPKKTEQSISLSQRLQSTFGWATYALLARLLSLAPARFCVFLGRTLGKISSNFLSRDRTISRTQLAFCNIKEVPDPEKTTRDVFGHVGESVIEILMLGKLLARNPDLSNVIEEDGAEHVTTLKSQCEHGALALSGHVGCFELLAAYYATHSLPLAVVGRYPNSRFFGAMLEAVRASYEVRAIWRTGRGAAVQILKSLKEGKILAVLINQDTNLENEFSPFFGMEAASPSMPITLAVKRELPIVTSFIVRTGTLQHRVITRPIEYDPREKDVVKKILDVYNRRLETIIREYPEQWIWWHKRWRRRPGINYKQEPRKLRSTSKYISWLKQQRNA